MLKLTEIIKDGENYKYEPMLVNEHQILVVETKEYVPEIAVLDKKTHEAPAPKRVGQITMIGGIMIGTVEKAEQIFELMKGKKIDSKGAEHII